MAALSGVAITASALALLVALAIGPISGAGWSGVLWAAGCLASAALAAVFTVAIQTD